MVIQFILKMKTPKVLYLGSYGVEMRDSLTSIQGWSYNLHKHPYPYQHIHYASTQKWKITFRTPVHETDTELVIISNHTFPIFKECFLLNESVPNSMINGLLIPQKKHCLQDFWFSSVGPFNYALWCHSVSFTNTLTDKWQIHKIK